MAQITRLSSKTLGVFKTKRLFGSQRFMSSLAGIDASKLEVHLTDSPKAKSPYDKLKFGYEFADHMLQVDWVNTKGWDSPRICKHGPLSIDPAASSLHYALQCFEGMKAYIDSEGVPRLFRPEMNMARLNRSMQRLQMPGFDGEQFLECIKKLVVIDKSWIPKDDGYSLYVRPTGISTTPFLGVGPPTHVKLFVITSPVGPYYPEGFAPVSLYADSKNIRAWPGGTGEYKIGGNYGPTINPQIEAGKKGYSQVLWLFGKDAYITEVGTMNFFLFWKNEAGEDELVTPPLDGTILPGVTRQSILDLTREWGEFKVSESPITMAQLTQAVAENRVHECFGAGTAAVVSPINRIGYNGKDYTLPLNKDDPSASAGKLTQRLWDSLIAIQYGRVEHPWSVALE